MAVIKQGVDILATLGQEPLSFHVL